MEKWLVYKRRFTEEDGEPHTVPRFCYEKWRIMDELLASVQNVFIFIGDILIVTKGTLEDHEEKVRVLKF